MNIPGDVESVFHKINTSDVAFINFTKLTFTEYSLSLFRLSKRLLLKENQILNNILKSMTRHGIFQFFFIKDILANFLKSYSKLFSITVFLLFRSFLLWDLFSFFSFPFQYSNATALLLDSSKVQRAEITDLFLVQCQISFTEFSNWQVDLYP